MSSTKLKKNEPYIIEWQNIYQGCDKPVLKGISFSIRQGEKLVVVGENGAGKSTIIKLALGLYKPDSGSISINGRSVYDMKVEERQKLLSCVFQDYTKYQVTVRENIGFGNIKYINDDEKITKAAKKGCHMTLLIACHMVMTLC
ncbi:ATP-binding cassette domain-containing protein [Clostridium sp. DMHC 10]|uniref:ATP-binding cassette domain-containing protein n=1 Tax=Clostridium sp. DMHC 10 TaxID=747377 RepID=UPI00069EC696|nr:ATP-binding cassette domain-containing protein [Clostridium sp. DMHC 10]